MWKNKFIYLNVRKLKGNSINTLDAEEVSFSLRHSLIQMSVAQYNIFTRMHTNVVVVIVE